LFVKLSVAFVKQLAVLAVNRTAPPIGEPVYRLRRKGFRLSYRIPTLDPLVVTGEYI
jgi:hypothetical protein